jgi:UDP-glucose 4-epimerase
MTMPTTTHSVAQRALVTGGAGFIGSHLVDALTSLGVSVRVLDDLSTGDPANLPADVDLHRASVVDVDAVVSAVDGVDTIYHLAALGSVARSVARPLETDAVNVRGTLHVLDAARLSGVRRVIYASSSSVYGYAAPVPTPETAPTRPASPYAVTKLTGEHYARVYSAIFGLETISLRYFNVFGPRQRADSEYAAVIPLFIRAMKTGRRPMIFGDGEQTRDFTYVSDTVAATIAAGNAPSGVAQGGVYNVAGGSSHSLRRLLEILGVALGVSPNPEYGPPREGDIRQSQADPTAIRRDLHFECGVTFEEGVRRTIETYRREG